MATPSDEHLNSKASPVKSFAFIKRWADLLIAIGNETHTPFTEIAIDSDPTECSFDNCPLICSLKPGQALVSRGISAASGIESMFLYINEGKSLIEIGPTHVFVVPVGAASWLHIRGQRVRVKKIVVEPVGP